MEITLVKRRDGTVIKFISLENFLEEGEERTAVAKSKLKYNNKT